MLSVCFIPLLKMNQLKCIGVEAAGDGVATGRHSAPLCAGRPGVLHGNRTYLMADDDGEIIETHSISAGLDYPGVGPEHAWLKDTGRATYVNITDTEALGRFLCLDAHGRHYSCTGIQPCHGLHHETCSHYE